MPVRLAYEVLHYNTFAYLPNFVTLRANVEIYMNRRCIRVCKRICTGCVLLLPAQFVDVRPLAAVVHVKA